MPVCCGSLNTYNMGMSDLRAARHQDNPLCIALLDHLHLDSEISKPHVGVKHASQVQNKTITMLM
jgi:hypothetical protein